MKINCVVSRYKKDTNWVNRLKGIDNVFIYDKENPSNKYNIPVNKGQEASVYLKYIVDHYNELADYTFFTHNDEFSWHHTGSIITKYNEAVSKAKENVLFYNINDSCILGNILNDKWYNEILEWYDKYIDKYIPRRRLPHPNWTEGQRGSAQFLVHKSLITHLPKQFYEDLYEWITTTTLCNYKTSRFMEWTWHIFWVIYPNNIK